MPVVVTVQCVALPDFAAAGNCACCRHCCAPADDGVVHRGHPHQPHKYVLVACVCVCMCVCNVCVCVWHTPHLRCFRCSPLAEFAVLVTPFDVIKNRLQAQNQPQGLLLFPRSHGLLFHSFHSVSCGFQPLFFCLSGVCVCVCDLAAARNCSYVVSSYSAHGATSSSSSSSSSSASLSSSSSSPGRQHQYQPKYCEACGTPHAPRIRFRGTMVRLPPFSLARSFVCVCVCVCMCVGHSDENTLKRKTNM